LAARLGSAAGVTKARLLGTGNKRAGMKVSLGGRYRIDEFAAAIERVLENFRANGVEEIHTANLYLNIYKSKRAVKLVDENGNEIEHLKFDGPEERRFHPSTENVKIGKSNARIVVGSGPSGSVS
jgi:hypothetical protein